MISKNVHKIMFSLIWGGGFLCVQVMPLLVRCAAPVPVYDIDSKSGVRIQIRLLFATQMEIKANHALAPEGEKRPKTKIVCTLRAGMNVAQFKLLDTKLANLNRNGKVVLENYHAEELLRIKIR